MDTRPRLAKDTGRAGESDPLGGDPETLLDWFRWARRVVLGLGVFFLALFALRRSPASLIISGGLLGLVYPALLFGVYWTRRGRMGLGLAGASAGLWLATVGVSTRGTVSLAVMVPIVFLPVIIALPHLSRRALLRMVFGAIAVSGVSAALAAAGPLMPSTLSDQVLATIAVPLILITVGLALIAIWYVGSHLRESLGETQAINRALTDAERLLEHKVEQRTAELAAKKAEVERALAEVSDIDEIARTANATLDVGRVVEVAHGAVQKIFPSDLTGVALLDERREMLTLCHPKGAGWTPEAIEHVSKMRIPLTEEKSGIAHVVRSGRPFFAGDIGPDIVAAMSDTDRSIFETIAAVSLLFCPLEVEGEPIGLIVFANTHETVRLERNAVEQIRRYVRPLSAAIRNARLFEEARTALAETSDIDEISRTANSTLDARRVMQRVLNALRRVFPFDGMSVGLLDERREWLTLQLPMGPGMSPEALDRLSELRIPMEETASVFSHVVRNNQPFFLADVRPEIVDAMSLSDRRLYELYRPDSILICPLEVEGVVVGLTLLVNGSKTVDLDRTDIQRIQRYLTPLSTSIRNARLYEDAKAARGAAVEANQAKSQFLANMSHELRTPLTAIIGYAEMLKEEVGDQLEDYLDDLEQIHRSGGYLLELINGVLDLSKIEAGKMDVYLERCDVGGLVRDVMDTVRPLIEKKSNELVVSDLGALGSMLTDVTKVRQTLLNLLSNASKFTEGDKIRLEIERSSEDGGDWLMFRVADSGIGMSDGQCARIFEVFAQADAATTRQYGGTGLGLAITKQFCEMLGGSIEVASELGKGTTFTVRLPAETLLEGGAEEARAAVGAAAAEAGAKTVLVVDDDPAARDLIRRFLAQQGFGVHTAANGRQALRLARERRPDVITLDVVMPDMDGWTVLGELKTDPELADTPVILLSITEDKNLGYALGASEYLTKPIDWKRLSTVLRKYGHGEKRTALVVDDDHQIREMLRRGLERAGWGTAEATNGRVALERVAVDVPALILLDLMMPEMDGFEFLEELRRNEVWREVPVVVLTAKDLTEEDRARLNGGVTRILEKGSWGPRELLDEVRSLVGEGARAGTQD